MAPRAASWPAWCLPAKVLQGSENCSLSFVGPPLQDEDRKLASLVQKYGNSWAEISRCLPGRTGGRIVKRGNGGERSVSVSCRQPFYGRLAAV